VPASTCLPFYAAVIPSVVTRLIRQSAYPSLKYQRRCYGLDESSYDLDAQCFHRKRNPIVPVMTKEFTLTLQGTFTGQGHFVVCGVPVPKAVSVSARRKPCIRGELRRALPPDAHGCILDRSFAATAMRC
jgi:hypothetical protein